MSSRSAKLRPWPGATFRLKTNWEKWDDAKHFRVYLERRTLGRFGRLEAMHAVVPKRKRLEGVDRFFASAKYRLNMLRVAGEVLTNAGVPKEQANAFMAAIQREYPAPTKENIFLEEVESPLMALALGRRQKELSYYKTGVPEFTGEDQRLLNDCMEDLRQRMKTDGTLAARFLEIGLVGKFPF